MSQHRHVLDFSRTFSMVRKTCIRGVEAGMFLIGNALDAEGTQGVGDKAHLMACQLNCYFRTVVAQNQAQRQSCVLCTMIKFLKGPSRRNKCYIARDPAAKIAVTSISIDSGTA
jgi:hypothetical protein